MSMIKTGVAPKHGKGSAIIKINKEDEGRELNKFANESHYEEDNLLDKKADKLIRKTDSTYFLGNE